MKMKSLPSVFKILWLCYFIGTLVVPLFCSSNCSTPALICLFCSKRSLCSRKSSSHTHLCYLLFTFVSDKTQLVDEGFAGLASVEVYLIWRSEGQWLIMDQGLKRKGQGEAQVVFEL